VDGEEMKNIRLRGNLEGKKEKYCGKKENLSRLTACQRFNRRLEMLSVNLCEGSVFLLAIKPLAKTDESSRHRKTLKQSCKLKQALSPPNENAPQSLSFNFIPTT
jgi:hypothetical protein